MAQRKGGLGSRSPRSASDALADRTVNLLSASPRSSGKPPHSRNVYLYPDAYEALRLLSFQTRRSQHSLLMEGLARVFEAHGVEVPASLREAKGDGEQPDLLSADE